MDNQWIGRGPRRLFTGAKNAEGAEQRGLGAYADQPSSSRLWRQTAVKNEGLDPGTIWLRYLTKLLYF